MRFEMLGTGRLRERRSFAVLERLGQVAGTGPVWSVEGTSVSDALATAIVSAGETLLSFLIDALAESAGRSRMRRTWRFEDRLIRSQWLTESVHDVLAYFASVYRRAGYYGRIRPWIGIDNADDTVLGVGPDLASPHREAEPERYFRAYVPDTNVESLGHDPLPIAHQAMGHLWQAYGWQRCLLFDEEGNYAPR